MVYDYFDQLINTPYGLWLAETIVGQPLSVDRAFFRAKYRPGDTFIKVYIRIICALLLNHQQ